jgi:hypothetical protein
MASKRDVLRAICDVLGSRHPTYLDLEKAIQSGDELSLYLCHVGLEALPYNQKQALAERVRLL